MSIRIPEPAVSRRTLQLISALLWLFVGLGLATRAAFWFAEDTHRTWPWIIPLAVLLGLLKGRFALAHLAAKNVERIRSLSPHKEKICVFAFQSLQAFATIALMIALGVVLRHLPLRRDILAGLYLLVGVGLMRGSIAYLKS